MEEERKSEKFESVCVEHSKECMRMLVWAFSIIVAILAASSDNVNQYLEKMSPWLYVAFYCFTAAITYGYYTHFDRVVCSHREVKKNALTKRLWTDFIIQTLGLMVGYIILLYAIYDMAKPLAGSNAEKWNGVYYSCFVLPTIFFARWPINFIWLFGKAAYYSLLEEKNTKI